MLYFNTSNSILLQDLAVFLCSGKTIKTNKYNNKRSFFLYFQENLSKQFRNNFLYKNHRRSLKLIRKLIQSITFSYTTLKNRL